MGVLDVVLNIGKSHILNGTDCGDTVTKVMYMYYPGQKKYNRLHRYAPHNNV